MSITLVEPTDLDFEKPSSNCKDYSEIGKKLKDGGIVYYYFTANKDSQLQGSGISELQRKLAYVLKFKSPQAYIKLYGDENIRKELTCGIYGPQTTLAVMIFQRDFMDSAFRKHKYSYKSGFGSFGPNTKKRLDELYEEVKSSDEYKKFIDSKESIKDRLEKNSELTAYQLNLYKTFYKDTEGYY